MTKTEKYIAEQKAKIAAEKERIRLKREQYLDELIPYAKRVRRFHRNDSKGQAILGEIRTIDKQIQTVSQALIELSRERKKFSDEKSKSFITSVALRNGKLTYTTDEAREKEVDECMKQIETNMSAKQEEMKALKARRAERYGVYLADCKPENMTYG